MHAVDKDINNELNTQAINYSFLNSSLKCKFQKVCICESMYMCGLMNLDLHTNT